MVSAALRLVVLVVDQMAELRINRTAVAATCFDRKLEARRPRRGGRAAFAEDAQREHLIDLAAFRGNYTAETMRLASRMANVTMVKFGP